jgi:hypothetical protein
MRFAWLVSLMAFAPVAVAQEAASEGEAAATEEAAAPEAPAAEEAAAPEAPAAEEAAAPEAPAAEEAAAPEAPAAEEAAETPAAGEETPSPDSAEALSPQQEDPRTIAVISNLDFGLGKDAKGRWVATEDFRWTRALSTYLDALMDREEPVDLVVAGGLLNLWQAPSDLSCSGPDCQGQQVVRTAEAIVAAHGQDLALLGRFSRVNDNRIYIVPSGKDGELADGKVWAPVKEAMLQEVDEEALAALQPPPPPEPEPEADEEEADLLGDEDEEASEEAAEEEVAEVVEEPPRELGEAQIYVVTEGHWASVNGQVVVSPGQDLAPDARLVQRLINEREADLPLIDNLRPFSRGALLSLEGEPKNVAEVGQFLHDYTVTTAPARRSRALSEQGSDNRPEWNAKKARKRGHLVFVDSLHPDLGVRAGLLNAPGESWLALREALAQEADSLSVSEVDAICDQIAINNGLMSSKGSYPRCDLGKDDTTRISDGKSAWVGEKIREQHPRQDTMGMYIYGTTNDPESNWEIPKDRRGRDMLTVYNSGAFQRVADAKIYRAMTAKLMGKKDSSVSNREMTATMGKLDLRHFPACYSTVLVEFDESLPSAELKHWYLPEKAQEGSFVTTCDRRCGWAAEMCR